jgi:hypothetical protein
VGFGGWGHAGSVAPLQLLPAHDSAATSASETFGQERPTLAVRSWREPTWTSPAIESAKSFG